MTFRRFLMLAGVLQPVLVTYAIASCSQLLSDAKALEPSLNPYVAQSYVETSLPVLYLTLLHFRYAEGTTFSTPDASVSYNSPVPNLAAFCRFGAEFNTSTKSKVRFEVWMPTKEHWNGELQLMRQDQKTHS